MAPQSSVAMPSANYGALGISPIRFSQNDVRGDSAGSLSETSIQFPIEQTIQPQSAPIKKQDDSNQLNASSSTDTSNDYAFRPR